MTYADLVAWSVELGLLEATEEEIPEGEVALMEVLFALYNYAPALGMDMTAGEDVILSVSDEEVPEDVQAAVKWALGMGIVEAVDGELDMTVAVTVSELNTMMETLLATVVTDEEVAEEVEEEVVEEEEEEIVVVSSTPLGRERANMREVTAKRNNKPSLS